jgi:predicted NACHT family NTPase
VKKHFIYCYEILTMDQPKSPDDNQASLPETGIRQEAVHSTFGGGQQAATGKGNVQNQGNNNWLGNTWNVFFGQQTTTPVGNPDRPKNELILLAAVKEEVTARLRQSLHNAVLINLGKESQPQQVKRPWDAEIKIGLKPAVPLPDTTTILEVFDSQEIAGKLLILGAPGSGKTTTQLELAQALVSRAEEQPEYPVPVLFNLSSWKDDRQSITDWLVAELKSKYGVSKKLGKEWIDNHQLLPLLDGLDELEPQRQELCVQKINQFLAGENRPLYLVVCSRSEEYSNYSTQLQLNGAIYLEPLTNNQICDYLTSINYIELWSTISNDLDLLELLKTPLLLSITVLASQEISVEEWQHLNSTAERIQYLLDAYVARMLTRDINSKAYLKNKTPNARKTRIWLVWLAGQMQRESKTEFLIEEMQPSWLISETQKNSYTLVVWLFLGVIFLLLGGLFGGLQWLLLGLFFGLIFWLFFGLDSNTIKPVENIKLFKYYKYIFVGLFVGLIFGLFFGLFFGLIFGVSVGESFGLIFGVIVGLFFWVIVGLIFGLVFGLIGWKTEGQTELAIEDKKIANQGIWKSASNAVFLGLSLGLSLGLLFSLFLVLFVTMFFGPFVGLIFGIFVVLIFGVFVGLIFGGLTCIQHFSLRLILYSNSYIPWNYARFLNYCTERLFLQRVGGRYRFIHKLLQDHFAQMEFKRD